jgi:hypothetical protein
MQQALENASRPSQSKNKALKKVSSMWNVLIGSREKEVYIDHIEEWQFKESLTIFRDS